MATLARHCGTHSKKGVWRVYFLVCLKVTTVGEPLSMSKAHYIANRTDLAAVRAYQGLRLLVLLEANRLHVFMGCMLHGTVYDTENVPLKSSSIERVNVKIHEIKAFNQTSSSHWCTTGALPHT